MIKLLVRGWTEIPHSYAIVNCFQLIALYKKYVKNNQLEIYIQEMEYFRTHWNNCKKSVYSKEDTLILQNLKKWNNEHVDIVYSITYPYDISPVINTTNNEIIPKCVFYTSEFAWLNEQYFVNNKVPFANSEDIIKHINDKKNRLYFTAPSVWSAMGLKKWDIEDSRNRIITHGVDPDLFFMHKTDATRNKIREFYKVADEDVLLINIGGMTQNKGIELMLAVLHKLVNEDNRKNYKLLLKGMGDLYSSQAFMETYLQTMKETGVPSEQLDNLVTNHIIFTDKTLSYQQINNLYNAADYYLSPYIAEGFNLTVLESLCAGLPVIVPKTGSTKEYIEDIFLNGNGSPFVNYIESQVVLYQNGIFQNKIDYNSLYNVLVNCRPKNTSLLYLKYDNLRNFIIQNYSWERVSELLYNYFISF